MTILCFGFGGTKFTIGVSTEEKIVASSGDIYWREIDLFQMCLNSHSPESFCDSVVELIFRFLYNCSIEVSDVICFGFPFPGPQCEGRWYSNNLTPAFETGVRLEDELRNAFLRKLEQKFNSKIAVIFDAQCDAAGELIAEGGRLNGYIGKALVINLATGIACGLVRDGKVLSSDESFQSILGDGYDGGTGQIGRHLWYHCVEECWSYHFVPHGQTAVVLDSERLTDRLSGPALCGRFLHELYYFEQGSTLAEYPSEWKFYLKGLPRLELDECGVKPLTDFARQLPREMVTDTLKYASIIKCMEEAFITRFIQQIANELVDCLETLSLVTAWKPFLETVVLTGGIGINFMSAENSPHDPLLTIIRKRLPAISIERSILKNSLEREIVIFQCDLIR